MKINEKIEEMQSKLIKTVIEVDSHNKDEAVRVLEEFGLNNDLATKLLLSYRQAEDAKKTAKDAWKTFLENTSGVDESTDIAEIQDREAETRQCFDSVNAECALMIVVNTIEPNDINEEFLNELYQIGVKETQITNPSVRIAFHYYSECKSKDIQRSADLDKVREYSSKVANEMTFLRTRLQEEEIQNKTLKNENESLRSENNLLRSSYKTLQNKFKARVESDEKHYQTALSQIAVLKNMVSKLQDRGIFQTIGAKLTGLFRNKSKELQESTVQIPKTLHEGSAEKIGLRELSEQNIMMTNLAKDSNSHTINQTSSYDEWQQ